MAGPPHRAGGWRRSPVVAPLLRLQLVVLAAAVLVAAVSGDPIMWSGAVTDSSASIRVEVPAAGGYLTVSLEDPTLAVEAAIVAQEYRKPGVAAMTVLGLQTSKQYYYGVVASELGSQLLTPVGKFKTFPQQGLPTSFTFAFASCAETGYDHPVFTEIAAREPLFFMHGGDLHYENINTNSTTWREDAYHAVFASPTQASFFRSQPTVYMWDDHDFGDNNADGNSKGSVVAREYYERWVPHYPLVQGNGNNPIYHAYTVGRVRFIVLDLRSQSAMPSSRNSTMGYTQRAWFLNELKAYASYAMIVVLSSKPWMGPPGCAEDRWCGYYEERKYLSDQMVQIGVNNMVMLTGDAHMVGMDDGSHNDYSTSGGAGFPIFHSAPLAQFGSSKQTGPFSAGCFGYRLYFSHMYSTMTITDDGTNVCLDAKAYLAANPNPKVSMKLCAPFMKKGTNAGAAGPFCTISLAPPVIIAACALLVASGLVAAVFWLVMWRCGAKALEHSRQQLVQMAQEEDVAGVVFDPVVFSPPPARRLSRTVPADAPERAELPDGTVEHSNLGMYMAYRGSGQPAAPPASSGGVRRKHTASGNGSTRESDAGVL